MLTPADERKQREKLLRSSCYLPDSWSLDLPGKVHRETDADGKIFYLLADDGLGCYGLMRGDRLIVSGNISPQYGSWVIIQCGEQLFLRMFELAPERSKLHKIEIFVHQGDEIIGMQLASQGESMLIVSANGMGKKTMLDEFGPQLRGGKGVKCYKINSRTGHLIGAKAVKEDQEVMLITSEGIIIRINVSDISMLGRITSGVKLINLDAGVKVARIAKVREKISAGDQEYDNIDDIPEDAIGEAIGDTEDDFEEYDSEAILEEDTEEISEDDEE